jgi:hypothetical protein
MKRSSVFLFGLFLVLLNGPSARSQGCATTLSPHFSVDNSVARDGTTIYTAVSMQGYASVAQGPGCNMSTATHHVGAENKLNNIDHWTYSANGCPTCYFSATNNEQIIGVPGIVYPWNWDGIAICSIVGTFSGIGGGGSLPGCKAPAKETTVDVGFYPASFRERFEMTLSDTNKDTFDGATVKEVTASPGSNTCWWSTLGLAQHPGVTGSSWPIGSVNGTPNANQWGYDSIGWNLVDLDTIVQGGPTHGITFPCVITIHQEMQIQCNGSTTYTKYRTNDITITVDRNPNSEEVCRDLTGDGDCGIPEGFAYLTDDSGFEVARVFSSIDTGHRRGSPQD